jgi:hypothetical protein
MIKSENTCPLCSDAEAITQSNVDIEPVAGCPSLERLSCLDEPQVTRIIPGTGAPAPTPTEYEVLTESCDWCIVDAPWSGEDFEMTPSSSYEQGAENTKDEANKRLQKARNSNSLLETPTAPPKVHVNPPICSVDSKSRETLGIPMV